MKLTQSVVAHFVVVGWMTAFLVVPLLSGVAWASIPNIDVSQRAGNESEEAIAVNPTNPNNIVIFTNIAEGTAGMFLAVSFDGGVTWTRRIVGEDTNDVLGTPAAIRVCPSTNTATCS